VIDLSWQHAHDGNHYNNCERCKMPYGARQHRVFRGGEWVPITIEMEMSREEELDES
jgi:hypothetical protein